jgi:monovalent cation/hydrogen antiporter
LRRFEALCRGRRLVLEVQAHALTAAREEVLAARREPGGDPEAADRVLHRLDLRTVLLD